jgi:type IV pilus assembly protein PilV
MVAIETPIPARRLGAGFSLIEVLVTLLILCVGLLGVAALQFRGLQYNHDAYMRSQITFLAFDIADRMRLNADNVAAYEGNYTVSTNPGSNPCNPALGSDAANDLNCWRNNVDVALPPGSRATITDDNGEFTVTLIWTDRQGISHSVPFTFRP